MLLALLLRKPTPARTNLFPLLSWGLVCCLQVVPLSLPASAVIAPLMPALSQDCGAGLGLAVCPTLSLLVTSDFDQQSLTVFSLNRTRDSPLIAGAGAGAGAVGGGGGAAAAGAGAVGAAGAAGGGAGISCNKRFTLGGNSSAAPMRFRFRDASNVDECGSGFLAFTGDNIGSYPLLLVTDHGQNCIHVIDVVSKLHVGYMGGDPGSVQGPRGVAASGALVAVSCWTRGSHGHVVTLFQRALTSWEQVRIIGGEGQLCRPAGLKFLAGSCELAVADSGNHRISRYRVSDGQFLRQDAVAGTPWDLDQCEGGLLVARYDSHDVNFLCSDPDHNRHFGAHGNEAGQFACPVAVVLVANFGMVVRDVNKNRLQVF